MAALSDSQLGELRTRVRGQVLTAQDPEFEARRQVFNARHQHHPAAILKCTGRADVLHGLRFARDNGVQLSVKCGGHGSLGQSVCDGGLVLDLSPMEHVEVDPEKRRVRVAGGATGSKVNHETLIYDLITVTGSCPTVGVGGYTLGGGWGRLARSYGLCCDNVVSAEVVLADGRLVRASETENPDLLWALRGGGGGNFGIVTSFEYRLHPMPRQLACGVIAWPFHEAKTIVRSYIDHFAHKAPKELWLILGFTTFPRTPDGMKLVALIGFYNGPPEEGQKAIEPILNWAQPLFVDMGPRSYRELDPFAVAEIKPGLKYHNRGRFVADNPDDGLIDAMIESYQNAPKTLSPLAGISLNLLGGEIKRVPKDATAFFHRDRDFYLTCRSYWDDEADGPENIQWVEDFRAATAKYVTGGAYVNYLEKDLPDWQHAYYGSNYERLREVKRKYDPDNVFRHAQSIEP